MFEVNLINKPGIQDVETNVNIDVPDKNITNIPFSQHSTQKHKTNYFPYIVMLTICFICFIILLLTNLLVIGM